MSWFYPRWANWRKRKRGGSDNLGNEEKRTQKERVEGRPIRGGINPCIKGGGFEGKRGVVFWVLLQENVLYLFTTKTEDWGGEG